MKCWINHNISLIVIRRDIFKADLISNESLFSATAVEWIVVEFIFLAMLCGMQNLSSPTIQPLSPAGEA